MKFKSIIYINYFPYENSGKILDYLLENFEFVFLFCLDFHKIRQKDKHPSFVIFNKGRFKRRQRFFQLPIPKFLIFLTSPVSSLINLIQIIFYSYNIQREFGKVDIFFSVNAFTACIGVMLKKFKIVSKTVFWVWDYYPLVHKILLIALIRRIYWFFDKWATLSSDRVVFVNHRLLELRKKNGITPKRNNFSIVSLGTDKFKIAIKNKKEIKLGFIGVVKESMGLRVVFDNAEEIIKNFPNAKLEIIGSGPDESSLKKMAAESLLPTTFYGYLEEHIFNKVLKKCTIGIAIYLPDPSNVSYFGDAGKVKRYLSLGIPVLITDIFEFSEKVREYRAGEVVRYERPEDLIRGIRMIMANYKYYQKNALMLAHQLYYKKLYPNIFRF